MREGGIFLGRRSEKARVVFFLSPTLPDSGEAREKRPGEGKTTQQTPTSGSKRIAEKSPA